MNVERRRRGVPPPVFLAGALLVTILTGTVLLRLPVSHAGPAVSWLDAFFTATSATCVTGLVVVDTGTAFSGFGQAVILALIQVGGLGIMTIGTTVLLALGQRPSAVVRETLRGFAGHQQAIRPRDLLGMVILFTLVVEASGAALLFTAFVEHEPVPRAVWLALFHSVSAFCNAGFGLWSDSLVRYAGEPVVNLTVMALIIAGGVGFVVLVEVRFWIASRLRRRGYVRHFTLHSKIVLAATLVAITTGFVLILALEKGNALAGRPWPERLWIAAFQSVTARTAGFNTVDIAALSNPTLLVLIFLMFVGGGPGSMAGGIKLTSATTVVALVYHRLRGSREVRLFGRAIGEITLQRAVVLAILAAVLIAVVVCLIEIAEVTPPYTSERGEFFAVTFEAVSAFGTVGLSMGITSGLHSAAKLLIILLMYVGRLGPLWLMDFMQHLPADPPVRHASEELMVG
jgi:trk system potassium uptake protein TrkH